MALGDKTTANSIFEAIQKQVLLKRIGYLEPGMPQQFRHFGNYCTFGHYKFTIEPTTKLRANTNNMLIIDVHVDADWAGCPTSRKSTSGFSITCPGTTVAIGSRTQATIALSSAESEIPQIPLHTRPHQTRHHQNPQDPHTSSQQRTCLPNTSARKHYTGSFRALVYAYSTTNGRRSCFTTTTTSTFCV